MQTEPTEPLVMMPSSSQVLDHQLIFQIISVVGQFHHWQKREERRGELDNFIIRKKATTA